MVEQMGADSKGEAGRAEMEPWSLQSWGMSSWSDMGRGVGWGYLYEVVRLFEDSDAEGQLCRGRGPLGSQGDLAWGWVSNGL